MAAIPAEFDGKCPACGEEIVAGRDTIVCVDDEWIHEDCDE